MSDILDILDIGGMVVEAGLLGQVEIQHQEKENSCPALGVSRRG